MIRTILIWVGEALAAASLILLPVALFYLGCALGYTCP